ncbi:ketopantoate reductase PanE/ApbA-like protein [Streptomyces sp. T12]|uniref:ketopantoate reductase C-terminal domain-containing protein n=1 Tax=Streptomyces sp. T12 TaxID=477697 RepID=UPI0011ADC65A|nr:ketopantoate reductase C-terminal domain-containing protein [Streptomyces sp. T12]TWD13003.1 ketopantoate reductase PanE/ApbA-like protein [Streptomyces sp. T12]
MLAATALTDAPMADLIDRHRPAMTALAREVFAVADRRGIGLQEFDAFDPGPFRQGADATERDAAVDRLTAWLRTQPKHRSGIWRDLAAPPPRRGHHALRRRHLVRRPAGPVHHSAAGGHGRAR